MYSGWVESLIAKVKSTMTWASTFWNSSLRESSSQHTSQEGSQYILKLLINREREVFTAKFHSKTLPWKWLLYSVDSNNHRIMKQTTKKLKQYFWIYSPRDDSMRPHAYNAISIIQQTNNKKLKLQIKSCITC